MKNQNPWNLFSCILRSTADFWTNGRAIYERPGETGAEKGAAGSAEKPKAGPEDATKELRAAKATIAKFEQKDAAEKDLNARVDLWVDFVRRLKNNMPLFNKGDLQKALEEIDMEGALAMRVQAQTAGANRRASLSNQFRTEGALEDAVRQVIEAGHNVDWNKVIEGNKELTAVVHKIWNTDQPAWEKKGLDEELGRYGEYLNDSMLPDKYKEALGQLADLAEIFSDAHPESKKDLASIRREITQRSAKFPRYRDIYDFACKLTEVFRNHGGTPEECNEVFTISAAGNRLAIAQAATNITRSKPEEVQVARKAISEIKKGNGSVAALVGRESALWALREPERKAGKIPPTAVAAASGAAPPPAPAGAPARAPSAGPPTLGAGAGPDGIHNNRGEGMRTAQTPSAGPAEPKAPTAPRRAPRQKSKAAGTAKTPPEKTGEAEKKFAENGAQVEVNVVTRLRFRDANNWENVIGRFTKGTTLTVVDGTIHKHGGINFIKVKTTENKEGLVATKYLRPAPKAAAPEPVAVAPAPAPVAAPTAVPKAPEAPPIIASTAEKLPNPDRRDGKFIRDAVDDLKAGDTVYIVGDAIPPQAGYKTIERSDGTRLKMREGNLAPIEANNQEHLQAWDKFLAARFLKFREAAKSSPHLPKIDTAKIYMYQGNPVYFESKSGDETVVRDTAGRKNTIKGEVELTPADSNEQAQYVVLRYKEAQRAHDVETAYKQAEAYVENQQQQQRADEKASAEAKPEAPSATGG